MPRNNDIKKVLVIGSGPIVIGQAAEFDYAGTQACRSLKEEGVELHTGIMVKGRIKHLILHAHLFSQLYDFSLKLLIEYNSSLKLHIYCKSCGL